MSTGIGYGKTILFGEHFVVYGLPAIGISLSKKTEIEIEKANEMKIEGAIKKEIVLQGLEAIKKAMQMNSNFKVKIKSEFPIGSGLGSSAALSVAFVRALNDEFKLGLANEQVSAYAYEGEKVFHGTPSGIDNTLATFGGAIFFQKKNPPIGGNIIKPLKIAKPFHIVVANAGARKFTTSEIICAVRKRKENYPKIYESLFACAIEITNAAIKSIENGNLEELGELMDINHGLLSAIGVSSIRNEKIIAMAREFGAFGAKITGAGCGGNCVILAKNKKNAEEIATELIKSGYTALIAEVK